MNKRDRARTALQKWLATMTPEKFVEEHQGIEFSQFDNSPRVQLIEDSFEDFKSRTVSKKTISDLFLAQNSTFFFIKKIEIKCKREDILLARKQSKLLKDGNYSKLENRLTVESVVHNVEKLPISSEEQYLEVH